MLLIFYFIELLYFKRTIILTNFLLIIWVSLFVKEFKPPDVLNLC